MFNKETNKELSKYVVQLYQDEQRGIDYIASIMHIGTKRVKDILKGNGITIISNSTVFSDRFPTIEGKHYIAKDKETGIEYPDFKNLSGSLSKVLKDKSILIPPAPERRKYLKENNKYWHEQWFDIIPVDDIKTKKCPYCCWKTSDIENKSGAFEQHLNKIHNISKEEYLKSYPEERDYFTLVNKTLDLQMETDESKFVLCPVCGKKLKWLNQKHLAKHNLTKRDIYKKYDDSPILSDGTYQKMKDMAHHMNLWMESSEEKDKSIPEMALKSYIESLGFQTRKDRTILDGKEIDIYIPEKKLGIEFNGCKWHTEWFAGKGKDYHISKLNKANEKGIKLIQIFEDEYQYKRDIVFSKIRHALGKDYDLPRIAGRKCSIRQTDKTESERFLEHYHIQGSCSSSVYFGAYYEENLIAVMTFLREKEGYWNLTRFATNTDYICQGVGGKLFSAFVKAYNPIEVKSFADRRWTTDVNNNIYIKLGFKLDSILKPDYQYYNSHVDRYARFHKFGFRKAILAKKYGFPMEMTESEMAKAAGFDRIWNCGLIKYTYKGCPERIH